MKINTGEIKSRSEFVFFLNSLVIDFKANKESWSNKTLEDFLEALESWADDMDGYYENMGLSDNLNLDAVNWRVFADLLMAARVYE